MATYKTLEAAAKAHGQRLGVRGRTGGWLYRDGMRLCQGWRNYGASLIAANVIHVLDQDGCRIDREKTEHGVTVRPWRMLAQYPRTTFVLPEPEPLPPALAVPNGLLATPEAVVVDTRGGYVFRNGSDGLAFTVAGAKAFRDHRNEGLRVGTYKVYRLTEVED